jgi:small-conductance mechanosensitive channel
VHKAAYGMQEQGVIIADTVGIVLESLMGIWREALIRLPLLVAGLLVILLTWASARTATAVVVRVLTFRRAKRGLVDLMRQLVSVVAWVIGLTLTAVVVFPSMTPAKVLTGLGIGSIAVGFAFKDIVENFLAGFLILWRFPFDPGDWIRWEDTEGMVEEITIRMTLIRKVDGELVVLPNAKLFKEPVDVLTFKPTRRVTIICGVAYGEDVDESREVIRRAVEPLSTVNHRKPVEIFAQEFASSGINFEVTWWTGATPLEVRRSRDEVVAAVKRALDEAGIEIPFPYRTLTFKRPLRVAVDREKEA